MASAYACARTAPNRAFLPGFPAIQFADFVSAGEHGALWRLAELTGLLLLLLLL
jgi:hypothetical protein